MPLEDINKGFDLMKSGESIRGVVIVFSKSGLILNSGFGSGVQAWSIG
jgi:hypothetical protein